MRDTAFTRLLSWSLNPGVFSSTLPLSLSVKRLSSFSRSITGWFRASSAASSSKEKPDASRFLAFAAWSAFSSKYSDKLSACDACSIVFASRYCNPAVVQPTAFASSTPLVTPFFKRAPAATTVDSCNSCTGSRKCWTIGNSSGWLALSSLIFSFRDSFDICLELLLDLIASISSALFFFDDDLDLATETSCSTNSSSESSMKSSSSMPSSLACSTSLPASSSR
mmetsp:Transcript_22393/g.50809  ORF Transcript_22393/g.50809 Transcript_22393/m.50809 type:complete len:224 (-) Transcript_22393:357-1028(-)